MLNLITKYPKSFGAALVFHVVMAVVFTANFSFIDTEMAAPEIDVVQATAINEEQVLAELAALKAIEAKKRKAEKDRQKKLDKDVNRAKKLREKEQRRLKELERKRKKEQARKKKLEKERKLAEKKKKAADKNLKIAEKKQKEADKRRRLAEKASREAEAVRVIELEKQHQAVEDRKRAEAEKIRAEKIERKAKERALKAIEEQQRIDDAKARQQELADEERLLAASRGKKVKKIVARYTRIIAKQVRGSWRSKNFKPGLRCDVFVRMMPTGDVLQVEAKNCNGDKRFKRSVEDAVRAAAPLSLPPDKSLFPEFRELNFKFEP